MFHVFLGRPIFITLGRRDVQDTYRARYFVTSCILLIFCNQFVRYLFSICVKTKHSKFFRICFDVFFSLATALRNLICAVLASTFCFVAAEALVPPTLCRITNVIIVISAPHKRCISVFSLSRYCSARHCY